MPIPDFQKLMLPLLEFARDGKEYHVRDAVNHLSEKFGLTDLERGELLPSGNQPIFANRIGWARTYLSKAGLLSYPKRGFLKITERGGAILKNKPSSINVAYLLQFPEFVQFRSLRSQVVEKDWGDDSSAKSPEESLEFGYQSIRGKLASDLLEKVKACSPEFFERLVVELLVKMGYGGSLRDAGKAVGRSGDEGIDGIIKEDRLGLDVVYIQAKRWANVVDRQEIQKFAGALQGQRAKKVFLLPLLISLRVPASTSIRSIARSS